MKIQNIAEKIVYSEEKLTKRILFNEEEKVLNFILNFKPGQGVPPHQHDESALIVQVLFGQGELTIDEKSQNVVQGDVIYCQGQEYFSIKNIGDKDMSLFVVIAPNHNPDFAKEV
ncbi:MAG: cupin domain-containing protein [Fusobacteria bacterium]|nr:cupin domain-containing protein [Fusobacteriota bacterium]